MIRQVQLNDLESMITRETAQLTKAVMRSNKDAAAERLGPLHRSHKTEQTLKSALQTGKLKVT